MQVFDITFLATIWQMWQHVAFCEYCDENTADV